MLSRCRHTEQAFDTGYLSWLSSINQFNQFIFSVCTTHQGSPTDSNCEESETIPYACSIIVTCTCSRSSWNAKCSRWLEPAWNVGGVVKIVGLRFIFRRRIFHCSRVIHKLNIQGCLLGKDIVRVMRRLGHSVLNLGIYQMLSWAVIHDNNPDLIKEGICGI